MQSFDDYLEEARRNPEQNPKLSVYDQIKSYLDRDNVFVSFTSLEKIGINPRSSFQTPNGIYSYPLKESIREYGIDVKSSGLYKQFPFASKTEWFWIFEAKNYKKLLILTDSFYTQQKYIADVKKLETFFGKDPVAGLVDFNTFVETAEKNSRVNSYAGKIWNLTRCASADWNPRATKTKPNRWNKILREILGYDGAVDIEKRGIIHPSEPLQAVFFNKNVINELAKVQNRKNSFNELSINKYDLNREEFSNWYFHIIDNFGKDKLWLFLQKITNEDALIKIVKWGYVEHVIEASERGKLRPTFSLLWEIMRFFNDSNIQKQSDFVLKNLYNYFLDKEIIYFTQEFCQSYTTNRQIALSVYNNKKGIEPKYPLRVLNKLDDKTASFLIISNHRVFQFFENPSDTLKAVYNAIKEKT